MNTVCRRIVLTLLSTVVLASALATRRVSLNTADGNVEWQLARQVDLLGYTGLRISTPDFNYSG